MAEEKAMSITLYQVEHLPFDEVERIAYACDDNYAVSVKQVRVLAHRAAKAREEDLERIQELENEVTALEVQIMEAREEAE
jgi:hypothetical protein